MREYCDEMRCPNFMGDECALGFNIELRLPKSIAEAAHHDWGYVIAKACRRKYYGKKKLEITHS